MAGYLHFAPKTAQVLINRKTDKLIKDKSRKHTQLCSAKEARLKRVHGVQLPLYKVLEQTEVLR
jgi:hypothetical protein